MKSQSSEFYVGYLPMPPRHRTFLMVLLPIIGLAAICAAVVFSAQQNNPGDGYWDLDEAVTLTGRVTTNPYAVLTVPGRDGAADRQVLLVTTGKVGGGFAQPVDGEWVSVTGYVIERGGRTMLTVEHSHADIAVNPSEPEHTLRRVVALGHHQLVGEIIDPKCYFGAMKPGEGKIHKACATLCIAGGIPPMFMTRTAAGTRTYYLLTDADGSDLRDEKLDALLPYVADPVQIEGAIERWGDLLVCKLDVSSVERR